MGALFIGLRVLLFLAGVVLVLGTVQSAVRTFVLPRAASVRLSRTVFLVTRIVFSGISRRSSDYYVRDRVMALYAPASLLLLPVTWLLIAFVSYAAMLYVVDGAGGRLAFEISGSYLFTLGTDGAHSFAGRLVGYTESATGLAMLALLITYLPSIYAAFSRREALVALLEVRAGSPPAAVTMIERYALIGWLDRLEEMWRSWELWFVEVEESHTSLAALAFFRSPHPDHSWVTAAGTVLDAAALTASTLDLGERQPHAALCIRAGFLSLRRIGDFFGLQYDPNPRPDDPISIMRAEYDAVYEHLEALGVPLQADREQAWRDFRGWRVNYDAVLLGLAGLVMAPVAQWSSDRSIPYRPGVTGRGRRRR